MPKQCTHVTSAIEFDGVSLCEMNVGQRWMYTRRLEAGLWRMHEPQNVMSDVQANYGCVRLAPLGLPRCVTVFLSRTNVGNYLHTFVLEKTATRRGRPREAERTHPKFLHEQEGKKWIQKRAL